MAKIQINTFQELSARTGSEIALSDWVEVSQAAINRFAEATGDFQWIHVDVERARRESPYHQPIAHGFLTLSLVPRLLEAAVELPKARLVVNYGCNRVRFTGEVPAGSRVRARCVLAEFKSVEGGVQLTWSITIEREGRDKPALVVEWIARLYD
jgi:acyl dehydratase